MNWDFHSSSFFIAKWPPADSLWLKWLPLWTTESLEHLKGDLGLFFLITFWKEGSKTASHELVTLHLKCTCTLPRLTPSSSRVLYHQTGTFSSQLQSFTFYSTFPPLSYDNWKTESCGLLKTAKRQLQQSRGPHGRCHPDPYGGRRRLSFYRGFSSSAPQPRSGRRVSFLQQPPCWPA